MLSSCFCGDAIGLIGTSSLLLPVEDTTLKAEKRGSCLRGPDGRKGFNVTSKLTSLMGKLHYKYAYKPRVASLTSLFSKILFPTDRVLDVGCGSGILGVSLAERIPGLHVEGIDTHPRGGEPIFVRGYSGKALPFQDNAFDVVIIADVLHHDRAPVELLKECARVAQRLVIVKDHLRSSWFSYLCICLLDWAANVPHCVPCIYKYWSDDEWRRMFEQAGLRVESKIASINLYHWTLNFFFGGDLHFVAFTKPVKHQSLETLASSRP